MAWKTEITPAARHDLDEIFEHLFAAHRSLGNSVSTSVAMASTRVLGIADSRVRIAKAPHRGQKRFVHGRIYRFLTLDRAIFWFTLDEATETVRIVGIFHGGQDHLGRMLGRLTAEGEAG